MFTPETGHTKQAILISLLSLALILVLILVATALKMGKKTDQAVQKTPVSAEVPAQEASEVQAPANSDPRATANPEAPLPFNELRDISGTVTKIEGQTLSRLRFRLRQDHDLRSKSRAVHEDREAQDERKLRSPEQTGRTVRSLYKERRYPGGYRNRKHDPYQIGRKRPRQDFFRGHASFFRPGRPADTALRSDVFPD